MITITKIFHYEMAHALHRYDGACANIHGHSYRLEVTVTGPVITDAMNPKCGMIIDFGDLKQIVQNTVLNQFDHALVLNSAMVVETHGRAFLQNQFGNIIFVDYQPTNENLLVDFAQRIQSALPTDITLVCLRMYETNASFAEWTPNP
ncbi:MAG: 6-carboxytetrahydropterin synthase [Bacteroidales bacterium]|nr:6-carboxytetrahydropterin synthase [Bacteroidales bacterium]